MNKTKITLAKYWLLAIFIIQSSLAVAQLQKGFNFQGYARNSEGAAITSQSVNVKFTIYPKSQPGSPDFEETQTTTTDEFGVFQLMVGAVSSTQFKNLKFGDKDYWLKVEVKTGSSDFVTINETELLAVPYARSADNGVPAGTILPFAGPKTKIPFGYLACDGAQFNASDYPTLYNAIGNAWGGSGSQFNVPDLRGMFLRGVSETSGTDEDKETRTANAGGRSNDVGSKQLEGFRTHTHYGVTELSGAHTHEWRYGLQSGDNGGNNPWEFAWHFPTNSGEIPDPPPIAPVGNHNHEFTTQPAGGNETRPDNAYVYYIIKI